jgi:membrane-bound lytic murein transglycosylase MltF
MRRWSFSLRPALGVALMLALFGAGGQASGKDRELSASGRPVPKIGDNLDAFELPVPRPWTGDFDGMRERRLIRVLVPYSRTYYFIDRGRQLGIVHDLMTEFVASLNRKYKPKVKGLRIQVSFIPVTRDKLIPALVQGLGDIAAGDLTITPERARLVDFTEPMARDIHEVVVTGPEGPKLSSIDDLAGKSIPVRKSSSFYEHLVELNRTFASRGLPEITLPLLAEDLEDEDVLQMVNAGLLPMTVVDEPVATVWSRLFTKLAVHQDLVINHGGDIAWLVRKNSPLFLAETNAFVTKHRLGTTFANVVINKYISDKALKDSFSQVDRDRFEHLSSLFKRYGSEYDFDYLMVAAQGYQESQLNQDRRSPRGAVGVMQLLPRTAADPAIGITGIDRSADKNIEAGVKYLRFLVNTYLDDPKIDEKNRTLMAFAAYNAGPGNLQKFRRITEKSGLDPDIWFSNVEIAAARTVGRETVDYVSNIYKYYVAYKLAEQREESRAQSREKLQSASPQSR